MVFKFTVDNLTNRFIPSNQTNKLPGFIRHFLGNHKANPQSDYLIWLEVLISSFCGIGLLEGIFKSQTVFTGHHAPMIIASYGATAILCFNANQAPLSQPRNIFWGHFISSLVGICIQKLFSLGSGGRDNYWASGALSVGVASILMSIFNCVHPPAGASALLPSVDSEIQMMSWWYLPVQIISSLLIITVACITGNIIRSYPQYWWTPADVGNKKQQQQNQEQENKLEVKQKNTEEEEKFGVDVESLIYSETRDSINITSESIIIPKNIELTELDLEWLESFRTRIKNSLISTDKDNLV